MPRTKKTEDKPKTIARKVFFYRVNAGVQTDTGEPKLINFHPVLEHLHKMPFTDEGRYLTSEDGKQLCCWVDKSDALPYRIKLANIRRDLHPPVESEGDFLPLVLGAGKGLAEVTHFVLFADGVCGAEFNFYGPRASALGYYFAIKLKGVCSGFKLNPLVREDLEGRLANLTDIRLLDMKVRASYASVITAADEDLGAAFNATIKAVGARAHDELELVFQRKKNKKFLDRAVPSALLAAVKKLATNRELRDQVSTFQFKGVINGQTQPFDILSEQFTSVQTVKPALNSVGSG